MKSNFLKIISSSSAGNCYIYFDDIMLDIGVPYSKIKPYTQKIKLILLSHIHSDHLNIRTLKKMLYENPKIKIGCGWFLVEELLKEQIPPKNIFVFEVDKTYTFDNYVIKPAMALHDVPNFGYKILDKNNDYKVFHISDTSSIDYIEAKDYDLYAIEGNYETDENLKEIIKAEKKQYGFSYRERVLKTHLSQLQALNWLDKNKKETSEYIFIHQHKNRREKDENIEQKAL